MDILRFVKRRGHPNPVPLAAGSVLLLASCYPGDVANIQDLDTVVTVYNVDYDFAKNTTYAMPDFVVHVCEIEELDPPEDCVELSHDFDDLMLSLVADNMAAMGYTRIPVDQISDSNRPDVVALVTAVGSVTWFYYQSYPWWPAWGGWPGWGCCGPGYGWWYPGYISVGSYRSGTISVKLVDPDEPLPPEAEGEDLIPVQWDGALNGLLGSSAGSTATRLTDGIDQMFEQSAYLSAGN